jgi:hypothetical protein
VASGIDTCCISQETILVGLTNFRIEARPVVPRLNEERARFVLGKIDQILRWDQDVQNQRDTHFVALGRYLCEVRGGQYWRLENLKCFDEFLDRRFPDSRRKAYYLMSIHENLPRPLHRQLSQIGWSKATELVKVARRDGQRFESATWMHKAQSMPKQQFKDEVEKHLTGSSEPTDLIYFKLFRTQIPVIEQALEAAARLLGSDRSRGYCLEMICADFLAGANLENSDDAEILLITLRRYFQFLRPNQQAIFLEEQVGKRLDLATPTTNSGRIR